MDPKLVQPKSDDAATMQAKIKALEPIQPAKLDTKYAF